MARIYVASSCGNPYQQQLVNDLRKLGHQVYDFKHPSGRNDNNVWTEMGVDHVIQTNDSYEEAISRKEAVERFEEHRNAMQDADTCVLLLPSGRSSHVEAGWMAGLGKRVFVYNNDREVKPELMYRLFDGYFRFPFVEDLYKALAEPIPGVCRVCGCTERNPCYHPHWGYCHWVEPSLCSHCADLVDDDWNVRDDEDTQHCVNDKGNEFNGISHVKQGDDITEDKR